MQLLQNVTVTSIINLEGRGPKRYSLRYSMSKFLLIKQSFPQCGILILFQSLSLYWLWRSLFQRNLKSSYCQEIIFFSILYIDVRAGKATENLANKGSFPTIHSWVFWQFILTDSSDEAAIFLCGAILITQRKCFEMALEKQIIMWLWEGVWREWTERQRVLNWNNYQVVMANSMNLKWQHGWLGSWQREEKRG